MHVPKIVLFTFLTVVVGVVPAFAAGAGKSIVGGITRINRAIPMDDEALEDNARAMAFEALPHWRRIGVKAPSELLVKRMTDGVTNKIVKVSTPKGLPQHPLGNEVLVRVFGIGTENFINRGTELVFWQYLSMNGLAASVFAIFENGLVTGFLPGRTITTDEIRMPRFQTLIADAMAGLHSLPISDALLEEIGERMDLPENEVKSSNLWDTIDKFLTGVDWSKVPKKLAENKVSDEDIRREIKLVKDHLQEKMLDGPVVLSHNDVNQVNVIFSGEEVTGRAHPDRITLIDYEYASFNPRGFDLGNHICEYMGLPVCDPTRYPDKETQMPFLRGYVRADNRMMIEREEVHRQLNQVEQIQNIGSAAPVTEPEPESPDKELKMSDAQVEERAEELYIEVQKYALVSHLYWGSWAILQSQMSDIDWDYTEYSLTRFGRYYQDRDAFLAL